MNVPKRKKKSKKNKSKYVPQRYVSVRVRVPECTVGLVVGPCGQTIQQIQHATNTFIKAPTRLQEPIFEITGLNSKNIEIFRLSDFDKIKFYSR